MKRATSAGFQAILSAGWYFFKTFSKTSKRALLSSILKGWGYLELMRICKFTYGYWVSLKNEVFKRLKVSLRV